MAKLEGIVNLRGKNVVLEDIENPVLKNVLQSRLSGERFNFWHSEQAYRESTYSDKNSKNHNDRHRDNYSDEHNDNHRDVSYYNENFDDDGCSLNKRSMYYEDHKDKGYSEKHGSGHNEHIDYY